LDDIRARITKDGIRIYEDADFAGMRTAGRVAAEILDAVAPLVVPGTTTAVIDDFITEEIRRRSVTSATIGYKGYKHASCISVNHVVCHGIPGTEGADGRGHPEHRRDRDRGRLVSATPAGCMWPDSWRGRPNV